MANQESRNLNERLNKIMPWGSSTCSKAPNLMPEEPSVIVRGKGCRVWDEQGREYIDYRNGLGPVSLGYQYPEVDNAIRRQLEQGIIFGHAHPIECEAAEMFCEYVPCAEQARFLKTGGEAIAACIRMARHYTGRDHIVQIGYNGWLNSLAAGTKVLPGQTAVNVPPGTPTCLSALHHSCGWNNIEKLKNLFDEFYGQIAAVVVAADYAGMEDGRTFYPAIRELTRKHGSLLIFDEIVTGFRISMGGVQEYFNIKPDLAVFGKAIANGMPLSVYAGSRDVMSACNKGGVTVSSTFGGETLSLAAAIAVMETYVKHDVTGHMWKEGEKLWSSVNKIFGQNGIPLKVKGFAPCPAISAIPDAPADTLSRFMRAAYKNGVSLYSVSYVNFSHKGKDIEETLDRLQLACKDI